MPLREIFKELEEFEDLLYSIEEYSGTYLDPLNNIQRKTDSKPFKFTDICKEFEFQSEAGLVKRVSIQIHSSKLSKTRSSVLHLKVCHLG